MITFKKLITIVTTMFGLNYYSVGNTKDLSGSEQKKIPLEGEVINSGLDGYNRHNMALR